MITFLDGPAAEVTVAILVAPRYLRVVQDSAGELAALDLPGDVPEPDETTFVYVLCSEPFTGFIDWSNGKGRQGGPFLMADYRLYETQPEDAVCRSSEAWGAWCEAQPTGEKVA